MPNSRMTRIACAAALTAVCLLTGATVTAQDEGDPAKPPAPAGPPAPGTPNELPDKAERARLAGGGDSAKAVFGLASEVVKAGFPERLVLLYAPEDRAYLLIQVYYMAALQTTASRDKAVTAAFKALNDKYGFKERPNKPTVKDAGGLRKVANEYFKDVDQVALLRDLFGFLSEHSPKERQPDFGGSFKGELTDLKTSETMAAGRGGEGKTRATVTFEKVGERWYLSLKPFSSGQSSGEGKSQGD